MKHIEDLIFEASLWALNFHNQYKILGKPHPDALIYRGFIDYHSEDKHVKLVVNKESRDSFLCKMQYHEKAVIFANTCLTIES
ncbi:hypothetical protein [Vibrio alfacsensis]|uniref:hypothetical protein n=1 Tax=Vibrio alfacsensis TaxID=1074311 RepID=UPI0040684F63